MFDGLERTVEFIRYNYLIKNKFVRFMMYVVILVMYLSVPYIIYQEYVNGKDPNDCPWKTMIFKFDGEK